MKALSEAAVPIRLAYRILSLIHCQVRERGRIHAFVAQRREVDGHGRVALTILSKR